MIWLASAHWPECVDDVYIVVDYGRHWAETGRLEWTTGERVEGFSSLALVAVAAGATLLKVAPELALKGLSLTSAIAMLGLVSLVLPTSVGGTMVILGLAACAPFAYWAADGMDAMVFALLISVGWVSVLRSSRHTALWILGLSVLVRPEGVVHFCLAGAAMCARERGFRPLAAMAMPAAFLAGLLGVRVWWFGELLPTPTLLKIVAVPWSRHGALQAAGDSIPFLGLLAAVIPRPSRWCNREVWIAALPLLIQAATLVRASGDWMTHARLLLPGAVATVLCLSASSQWVWSRRRWGLAAPLLVLGALTQPVGYGRIAVSLQRPPGPAAVVRDYCRGLVTPLPEDVAWIIEHVPDGASVLVNDVGFMGGMPSVRVLDLRGLVTRAIAEASASGAEDRWLGAMMLDPVRRPFAARLAFWGEPISVPAWLNPAYPRSETLRYSGGEVVWRFEYSPPIPASRVSNRWAALAAQHPNHAWVAWRNAVAAEAAELGSGAPILAAARLRFPFDDRFAGADSVSFVDSSGPLDWASDRGFALPVGGWLESATGLCAAGQIDLAVDLDVGPMGAQPAELVVHWISAAGVSTSGAALTVAAPATERLGALCPLGEVGRYRVGRVDGAGGPSRPPDQRSSAFRTIFVYRPSR